MEFVWLVARLCPTLCDPRDGSPPGSSVYGDSPGKNPGVRCHALLQGIFPTQGSNPDLLHSRWILYHLSHQGSPRILEWVAYLFSSGSSWPRNWTRVSCIASGFFPAELPGKPWQLSGIYLMKNAVEHFSYVYWILHHSSMFLLLIACSCSLSIIPLGLWVLLIDFSVNGY